MSTIPSVDSNLNSIPALGSLKGHLPALSLPKFTGAPSDYTTWKRSCTFAFLASGIQSHLVDPSLSVPTSTSGSSDHAAYSLFQNACASSSGNILGNLDFDSLLSVEHLRHPFLIFKKLDSLYASNSLLSKINLLSQLIDLSQSASQDSATHSAQYFAMIQKAKASGLVDGEFNMDDLFKMLFIRSLHSKYEAAFKDSMIAQMTNLFP